MTIQGSRHGLATRSSILPTTSTLGAASAREIAIKHALGRLELALAVDDYLPRQREPHGIEPLPIGEDASLALA